MLHLNLEALLGLRGTSLQVHVQSNRGGSISSEVGDLQGISNLEAPTEWRLYEAWVEQRIVEAGLSILLGIYDINGEFDVIPAAGDLLNGSFGFGPDYSLSGEAGPSTFPATGLAARVRVQPTRSLYGLMGVSDGGGGDGAPARSGWARFSLDAWDQALLSFEAGYERVQADAPSALGRSLQVERRGGGRGAGPSVQRRQRMRIGRGSTIEELGTKVAVGGWAYTQRLPSWDPAEPPGRSWGLYALGEQLLYRKRDGSVGLSGFTRVGTAADAVSRLDLFAGGGFAFRGALSGRPDDVAALGIAHARNGEMFLQRQLETGIPLEQGETVLELTYRAQVGRSLVIQPDVQWVMNPGMVPGVANALVFGLRGHILLELPRSG